MRRRISGKSTAIALVLGLLILAGIFLWAYRQRSTSGSSAFELAERIPEQAVLAVMFDGQGQLRLGRLWQELRAAVQELDEPQRQKFVKFEEGLGRPVEEWLSMFSGRGFLAVLPPSIDEDSLEIMGLLGLEKPDQLEAWLQDTAAREDVDWNPDIVQGIKTFSLDDGWTLGYDQDWIYFGYSAQSYQALLEAAQVPGNASLKSHPLFQEGQRSLDSHNSNLVMFVNLQSLWEKASELDLPHTDRQTFESLSALECLMGSLDLKRMQVDGLLKVAEHPGDLSKKLRTPGSLGSSSLSRFSSEVSAMNSFDLEWTFNSLIAVGMLSPSTRAEVGMIPLGLTFYGNPWLALDGEVAVGGQVVETLLTPLQANFLQAREEGQRTACLGNLKNIAIALEMWAADHEGAYPENLEALVGPYLVRIPTCPAAESDTYSASYQRKADPEWAEFSCSGQNHSNTEADHPRYDTLEGVETGALPTDEAVAPNPSVVAIAPVKDSTKAHALLVKLLDLHSTPEPGPGESRLYELGEPGLSLKLEATDPAAFILEVGPETGPLLDVEKGSLIGRPMVKDLMAWGGGGIVYFDYLNLEPVYSNLMDSLMDGSSREAKAAQKALARFQRYASKLEGASCLTVTEDGLRFRSKGFGNSGLIVGGSLAAAILVPNFIRARSQGQLTACKSNVRNIATALEMWAIDSQGQYPEAIEKLEPNYLRQIPTCPAAGFDTYSSSYYTSENRDRFGFNCEGSHHQAAGLPPDLPAFSSEYGLTEY